MDQARADSGAAQCRVRIGEPCRLCFPGASGPQDCGLAYLVTTDPALREQLLAMLAGAPAGGTG